MQAVHPHQAGLAARIGHRLDGGGSHVGAPQAELLVVAPVGVGGELHHAVPLGPLRPALVPVVRHGRYALDHRGRGGAWSAPTSGAAPPGRGLGTHGPAGTGSPVARSTMSTERPRPATEREAAGAEEDCARGGIADSASFLVVAGLLGLDRLALLPAAVCPAFVAPLEDLHLLALAFGLPQSPVFKRRATRFAFSQHREPLVGPCCASGALFV